MYIDLPGQKTLQFIYESARSVCKSLLKQAKDDVDFVDLHPKFAVGSYCNSILVNCNPQSGELLNEIHDELQGSLNIIKSTRLLV